MKERKQYSAREKCRAVLLVWSEKRRAVEVSRAMGVGDGVFWQWQERAMEGILQVLEPKWTEGETGPALGRSVKRLLDRKVQERQGRLPKLGQRLERLQNRSPEALAKEAPETASKG